MIRFLLNGEPVTEKKMHEPFVLGDRQTTVMEACAVAAVLLYVQVCAVRESDTPLKPEDTWIAIS